MNIKTIGKVKYNGRWVKITNSYASNILDILSQTVSVTKVPLEGVAMQALIEKGDIMGSAALNTVLGVLHDLGYDEIVIKDGNLASSSINKTRRNVAMANIGAK